MARTSTQAPLRETTKTKFRAPLRPRGRMTAILAMVLVTCFATGCRRPSLAPRRFLAPDRSQVLDDFWGTGWRLAGGASLDVSSEVPENSVLRFALRAEKDSTGARAWSVHLGDEPLDAGVFTPEETPLQTIELPLPAEGRPLTSLRFRVDGPAREHTAILNPVIGPADTAEVSHPPLALLVADTFRADNLRAWGATRDIAPRLDALARRGLVCADVTAPAPWTLPSHASMFSGLYPPEHGVLRESSALPAEVTTIAEVLRDAGYRTGAVTDGLYLDGAHGMDQGFDWFDARAGSIGETVERARAFLELDDGRPTFLFVQSYRAHDPYVATDRTREELAGELDIEHDWESLTELFAANPWGWQRGESVPPELDATVRDMHALYLGAARDLDRGFGELIDELEREGFLASGAVLFTSDHGEAFGEHEELLHGQTLFREELAVPLVLAGARIEPGRLDHPVSLVDIPRTLAELAGVPAPGDWRGDSLLGLEEDRPIYAFGSFFQRRPWTRSLRVGKTKWIQAVPPDGGLDDRFLYTFDLEQDPRELTNLAGEAAPGIPGPLPTRAQRELWRRHQQPRFPAAGAALDESALEDLRAAGYPGDELR